MSTAESIGGRKTLLNTLSASRTTVMSLWLSPDTVSIWNLTRKLRNQKDSQRHLITQVFNPDTMKVSKWFQGTTLSHVPILNSGLRLRNTPSCSRSALEPPRPTESSRHSSCPRRLSSPPCTQRSRLICLCLLRDTRHCDGLFLRGRSA